MQRWEVWPSKTRFYAAGKLLSGPDRASFYIALASTLLPLFCFWSTVLPWLIHHYPRWAIALQVISAYSILFALSNLFITAFMDPGIMPRRPDPSHGNPLSKKKPPSTHKITVNNIKQKVKYCDTCNIYRPPRATHCSICDNCVDRFDHHCPWVGNCVGRRNYRFFLLFVLGVSFNCFFAAGVSIADFVLVATTSGRTGAGARFVYALKHTPLALAIAVFSLIVGGFVSGLGGYHLYLLATAQTTNENLKNLYGKDKPNPYDLGFLRNCLYAFCPPHSAISVDFEQWLHPDTGREITEADAQPLLLTTSSSSSVSVVNNAGR